MSDENELAPWCRFDGQDVCYVIQPEVGGPFKIGHTTRVKERLTALQTSNGHLLVVRALLAGGRTTERQLHSWLRDWRLHDEWFDERAVPLVCEFIGRHDRREILDWSDSVVFGGPWSTSDYIDPAPAPADVRAAVQRLLIERATLAPPRRSQS